MKKIKIDKKKCVGCGTCGVICPEVFELGEDGKARVKSQEFKDLKVQKIQEAVDSCPVGAIKLGKAETPK